MRALSHRVFRQLTAGVVLAIITVTVVQGHAKTQRDRARSRPPGPRALPDTLPKPAHFVVLKLHAEVSRGMATVLRRVTDSLKSGDILVLDIRTFGGRVDAAVDIRDQLLRLGKKKVLSVAFINPRAISAGALISYATDMIAVAPGATMGAATPVQLGQGGVAKPVAEKVVSYMRSEMRATAEAKGRNGDIAEAMVDADVEIKGLSKKGKLLTLDGKKALRWGVASFEAEDPAAIYKKLGYAHQGKDYHVSQQRWTWGDRIAGWLSSAVVSGLLMSIGMLGLMIGLYSGGSPIPLSVGACCLGLFFFGHYVTRLVGLEDLLLLGLGMVLILIELLIVPGAMFFGLVGSLCILGSLFLGLVDFKHVPFSVQWQSGWITQAASVVFGAILASALLAVASVKLFPRSAWGRRLVLAEALAKGRGDHERPGEKSAGVELGALGVCETDLRPSGKVRVHGQRVEAIADSGFIAADSSVRIVGRKGFQWEVTGDQQEPSE